MHHGTLELDEDAWHSWSRAAAVRCEAGETVEDGLEFRDMARLEKLKAQAIEWEQRGHDDAEEVAGEVAGGEVAGGEVAGGEVADGEVAGAK